MIGFERQVYKVVSALLGLLLIVALYHRASPVDPFDDATESHVNGSSGATVQTAPESRPGRLANPPTNETWARAMDNILRDHTDVAAKSQRMLELLPRLPVSLQSEAAQHLVNFATDEMPDPVLRPLLQKSGDASAQGVLLLGLLQRIDTVRLPALLKIARDEQHARSADALKYLAFLMEQDHGTYWAAWERAVEQRLREKRL